MWTPDHLQTSCSKATKIIIWITRTIFVLMFPEAVCEWGKEAFVILKHYAFHQSTAPLCQFAWCTKVALNHSTMFTVLQSMPFYCIVCLRRLHGCVFNIHLPDESQMGRCPELFSVLVPQWWNELLFLIQTAESLAVFWSITFNLLRFFLCQDFLS